MDHKPIQHHDTPRAVSMNVTVDLVKGEPTIVSKTGICKKGRER